MSADNQSPMSPWERVAAFAAILWPFLALFAVIAASSLFGGCAYKGGKVVDGTNLAIGMTIPGTEWSINALDYVGGLRVAGNDQTAITVTNEVYETNSYFGVVTTQRKSKMSAKIEPCESQQPSDGGEGGEK